jgi:integrase
MEETGLITNEHSETEIMSPEEIGARRFEATLTGITLDVLASEHSKRAYRRALADFWTWHRGQGRPVLRKATIQRYGSALAEQGATAANINQRLCAIRRMVREAAENRLLDEADARSAAAVEGVSAPGRSVGVWLTKDQAETFINTIDRSTLAGKRDFALICLFLSSGLRRSEMASLTVEHINQVEGRWVILGIVGKRNKTRDVPIPSWAKFAADQWIEAAGIVEGVIFRPVNKGDKLAGGSLTPEAIRKIIDREINQVNNRLAIRGASLPRVAAHDLRRTFAQLARKGRASIEQIQLALGHESIKTTQTYLGGSQDFVNAPCDNLGLDVQLSR